MLTSQHKAHLQLSERSFPEEGHPTGSLPFPLKQLGRADRELQSQQIIFPANYRKPFPSQQRDAGHTSVVFIS